MQYWSLMSKNAKKQGIIFFMWTELSQRGSLVVLNFLTWKQPSYHYTMTKDNLKSQLLYIVTVSSSIIGLYSSDKPTTIYYITPVLSYHIIFGHFGEEYFRYTDWLIVWWFFDWLTHCFINWSFHWWIDWLNGHLIDWKQPDRYVFCPYISNSG